MSMTTAKPQEDKFILDNYLSIPVKTMAKMLNRSGCFVNKRISELKLIIPTEIIEQRKLLYQKKSGCIPFNKGLKQHEFMSAEAIEKTKLTRWKKGNIPHNTKDSDGIISIRHLSDNNDSRPYKYIRLSLGKWYPLHQYLWEQQHGKLKKSMCLWFKDGNTMNCSLDNLEEISRKENLNRNSGNEILSDKYVARMLAGNAHLNVEILPLIKEDPQLLEIKRNQLILKRKIKQHER